MEASLDISSATESEPDYAFGAIAEWHCPVGKDGRIVLSDGSAWHAVSNRKSYEAICETVELLFKRGKPIFISGDRKTGIVGFVSIPRALAVEGISDLMADRQIKVSFYGPPSVYHLRQDRSWFRAAEDLLRRSAQSGGSMSKPDLMISVDTLTNEILDVRRLRTSN